MKMKKAICIILSVIMLLMVCGCSKGEGGDETEPTEIENQDDGEDEGEGEMKPTSNARASFVLPYSEDDSINPYLSQSQINRALTTLLYDGLFSLDESFSPVGVLASGAEVTKESVIVTINENAAFSDSSLLSASDVVYSFEKARESERYSALLSNISSATAIEKYKVRFNLEKPDAFVRNILTFPIIRYGSGEKDVPAGSGRYVLSSKKLSYNKSHISGEKPKIKTIKLFSMSESTNFVDSLQIGNISFIFRDLSDCDIKRASARSVPVTLNNLVYLGINSSEGVLSDKNVRRAINLAIDKESIVSADYQGYAVRTESPFNPLWSESGEKDSVFDQSEAVELLEKEGYTYSSETDKYRRDKNGKTIELKIIVAQKNEFRKAAAESIAKNLTQIGFDASVTAVSFEKYKELVKEGRFDLYLGEIKLCENMSLSPFLEKSGKAHYGIDLKSTVVSSYNRLLSGSNTVSRFEDDFSKELPFIPVCYRQGVTMTSNTLSDNVKSTSTDIFSNITQWKMN